MVLRCFRIACAIGGFVLLVGCDPGALVKQKVPEPVKQILTFRDAAGSGGGSKVVAAIEIVSPKNNSVQSAAEPVVFNAKVKAEGGAPNVTPTVTWTLSEDKGKSLGKIGTGPTVKKQLAAGEYRVEATLTYGSQKQIRRGLFRVSPSASGKVVSADKTGLPGVQIKLLDPATGKDLEGDTSRNDGAFSVHLPADSYVIVRPEKKGFCFSPYQRFVKATQPSVPIEFSAINADVSALRFTDTADSSSQVEQICPSQEAVLSFDLKAPIKPATFDVELVRTRKKGEEILRFDRVRELDAGKAPDASDTRRLRVVLPAPGDFNVPAASYHVRLTVTDEKGNVYSAQVPAEIKLNMKECFSKALAQAATLHKAGNFQDAIAGYSLAERICSMLEDGTRVAGNTAKIRFDKGLAYLGHALAAKSGTVEQRESIFKARTDFAKVLEHESKDPDALLFQGLTNYLAGNFASALSDYNAVVLLAPQTARIRLLRAYALVKTGIKKNLSSAVDDFTEFLAENPQDKGLRNGRHEVLKLYMKHRKDTPTAKVDTSEIQLPPLGKALDLTRYIRQ